MDDNIPDKPQEHQIQVASGVALTVQLVPTCIKVYYLTEERLEIVASLNLTNAVHLAFLGISVGLLAAFWITLKTVELKTPTDHAVFVGLTLAAVLASLICGIQFAVGFVRSLRSINKIKETQVIKQIS